MFKLKRILVAVVVILMLLGMLAWFSYQSAFKKILITADIIVIDIPKGNSFDQIV